jgi:hypothetical protein
MLPAIRKALGTLTFDQVGADYGVAGNSLRSFLRRNGVDDKEYVKGRGTISPLTEDQKGLIRELVEQNKPFNEIATKVGRRKYGQILSFYQTIKNESLSMNDAEIVIDEEGRKVKRLPAGYAWGAMPQKSVQPVKGGY